MQILDKKYLFCVVKNTNKNRGERETDRSVVENRHTTIKEQLKLKTIHIFFSDSIQGRAQCSMQSRTPVKSRCRYG